MRIKVVTKNKSGKVELTVEELEQLINDAYNQGRWDAPSYRPWWYNHYPWYYTTTDVKSTPISLTSNSTTGCCSKCESNDTIPASTYNSEGPIAKSTYTTSRITYDSTKDEKPHVETKKWVGTTDSDGKTKFTRVPASLDDINFLIEEDDNE